MSYQWGYVPTGSRTVFDPQRSRLAHFALMSWISNSLVSVTQLARVTSTSERPQSAESRDRWFWRIHLHPHKSIVEPLQNKGRQRNNTGLSLCFADHTVLLRSGVKANSVAALQDLNHAHAHQPCNPEFILKGRKPQQNSKCSHFFFISK